MSAMSTDQGFGTNVSWTGVNTTSTNVSTTEWASSGALNVQSLQTALLAAIIAVVVLVIGMLFALALYIDCRQQRIEAEAAGNKKRSSPCKRPRLPVFIANRSVNNDALAFANQMCQENSATSVAGATCSASNSTIPARKDQLC